MRSLFTISIWRLFAVFFVMALGCALAACTGPMRLDETASIGTPSSGFLRRAVALPPDAENYRLLRPNDPTNFGTPGLVALVVEIADALARAHPGGAPLIVGDLSPRHGGRHPRHLSHRTGRDVDLFFPMEDDRGASYGGAPGVFLDRFGRLRENRLASALDLPRSWTVVRTALASREAEVQWIFVENGLKARLLRYAIGTESDPEIILRASWLIRQPTGALPHDDHFHIRIFCSPRERALGCVDRAPIWPWVDEKRELDVMPTLNDGALLSLMEEER